MNKKILKELIKVDLLNVNPTLTAQIRKKIKIQENKSIYKKIMTQYFISALTMILIYGLFFGFVIDYSKAPKAYDLFVIYLVILGTLQNFITVFNLFFENKDSLKMTYFPINQEEMFVSKTVLTMFSSLTVLSPVLLISIKFFIDFKFNIVLGIVYGILTFVVLFMFTILLNILLAELMARTSVLYKFNTQLMVGLNIFIQVVAVAFVIIVQNSSLLKATTSLGPISHLLSNPTSALIFILILGIIEIVASKFILNFASKNLYDHMEQIQNKKNSIRRTNIDKNPSNLNKELFKYNKSLLNDSTVITSCIVLPVMFPILMTFVNLGKFKESISNVDLTNLQLLAIALVISFMYSIFVGLFPMNLQSIIVSLDGQNHDYMMSLPISKKKYLLEKVKFSVKIMGTASSLTILAFSLFLGLKPIYIAIAILLNLISIWIFSKFKVASDYKHIYTNWSSISDIMNRQSRLSYTLKMMGLAFFTVTVFTVVMIAITEVNAKIILAAVSIPWALILIGFALYNALGFWKNIK